MEGLRHVVARGQLLKEDDCPQHPWGMGPDGRRREGEGHGSVLLATRQIGAVFFRSVVRIIQGRRIECWRSFIFRSWFSMALLSMTETCKLFQVVKSQPYCLRLNRGFLHSANILPVTLQSPVRGAVPVGEAGHVPIQCVTDTPKRSRRRRRNSSSSVFPWMPPPLLSDPKGGSPE